MPKKKYTDEWYRQQLTGVTIEGVGTFPSLRDYAKGFSAKDGYRLREVSKWTASQKRKVREYSKALHELQGRPHVVYSTRNKDELARVQQTAQHPEELKNFKVAFVPYTPPKNAPDDIPKVRVTKTSVTLESRYYDKQVFYFDGKTLAKDPEFEILIRTQEAKEQGYNHFTIASGMHQIGNIYQDPEQLYNAVVNLMSKYDGKKPLPQGSGNAGDKPDAHHYKKWLTGFIAYRFQPGGNSKKLAQDIERIRTERRKERDRLRHAIKRKNK